MKQKNYILSSLIAVLLFVGLSGFGQTVIVTQGFETDLDGYSHTPSQTPSSDPGDQYFYRAEPSNPDIYEGSVGPYTNVTGSWLFVGSNPNTINSENPGELTLSPISVVDYNDLEFHADFGACDNDWDPSDNLTVKYNFDGGEWITLFNFSSPVTNDPLVLEGNSTGGINTANGTILTYALLTISSDNFIGSGSVLNIKIECDAGANYEAFGVDNIIIKGVLSGGVINPSTFTSTPSSASQIELSWTQNISTNNVMVAWTSDGNFGSPIDGTSYSANDPIAGGGTVIYNGSSTSFNHTMLTAGAQYYYKAWSVDGSSSYSSGITDNATTFSIEPTNHVTGFAAVTTTSTTIPLTWTDVADAEHYLIKGMVSGGTITNPVDGTPETNSALVQNVDQGNEAYTFSGLTPSTEYTFKIFPYNGSDATVNYKTDGTVPDVTASTLSATTTLPYAQGFDSGLDDCSSYSVSGDTKDWTADNGYADMNGWGGNNPEEDWLILPAINFDNYSNVIMDFDVWWKYGNNDDNNYMKVMYSTDYPRSGNPSGSTWFEVSYRTPDDDDVWGNSSVVDFTSVTGSSVTIAFKYYSTDAPRHWEVDNIRVFEGTQVDVTFQVNMMNELVSSDGVHIAGNFNNWDPAATLMTDDDSDDVYTVTMSLFSTIEYQFKYINSNAWGTEESIPTDCQAPGTTNRYEVIEASSYSIDPVCFSSCTDCDFTPSYDITFQVDMANQTVSGDGVHLAGTFNSWVPDATPMTLQSGSTTIYEVTLSLEEASYNEYKFINGNSNSGYETVVGDCANGSGNRDITVPSENITKPLVCFGECDACIYSYDVTFQVDMAEETVSSDGVYLAGTFTNWGSEAILMTNTSGDLWETTVAIEQNTSQEYKFVNGNPTSTGEWEYFSGDCLIGDEGSNRFISVSTTNITLDQVCFNSCEACISDNNLIISELCSPSSGASGKFVEIFNSGDNAVYFDASTWYLSRQSNGGSTWGDILLTGNIQPGETFTIATGTDNSGFIAAYGFAPNMNSNVVNGNGDDGYFLYMDGNHSSGTLVDAYGVIDEDGSGKDWEYSSSKAVRLRSVTSPNSTWTASEWNIPIAASYNNMTPSEHNEDITWQGTTDNTWNSKGDNWNGTHNYIPDASFNVTIPSTGISNYPTIGAEAACNNIIIESNSGGDGSLIGQENLTIYGSTTIERYATAGVWHGISAPSAGNTFNNLYFNGAPDIWAASYDEATNGYVYANDLATSLGDMQGWMTWIDGSTAQTFEFTGTMRNGPVIRDNLNNSGHDTLGYHFIGNPYPSAIDWNSSGWTKNNIDGGIWVYDPSSSNFVTYNLTGGTIGGSQYIPMGQGFFIQVPNNSTAGSIEATSAVQVHNTEAFRKPQANTTPNLLKLKVTDGEFYDEAIIHLNATATEGYDGQLDMHKLFSFDVDNPQIYSTANNFMTVNCVPLETSMVEMDVTGKDGNELTISISEVNDLQEVYLSDEFTGIETNLLEESYTFTYSDAITNRFRVYLGTVDVIENTAETVKVFSYDNNIHIVAANANAQVEIINMLGQKVATTNVNNSTKDITMYQSGYYMVIVTTENGQKAHKVMVNL